MTGFLSLITAAFVTLGIVIGGGAGYSLHTGRAVEVDAVSGATTQNNYSEFTDHGLMGEVFMELPLFTYRGGVMELRPSGTATFPGPYYTAGASIIYRHRCSEGYRGGLGLKWISNDAGDSTLNYLSGVLNLGADFADIAGMILGAETEIAIGCFEGDRTEEDDLILDNYINYVQLKLVLSDMF